MYYPSVSTEWKDRADSKGIPSAFTIKSSLDSLERLCYPMGYMLSQTLYPGAGTFKTLLYQKQNHG